MSDIFLSYSSEDRPKAKLLSDALSALGWDVWWDRTVLPGETFDRVIEHELSAATCVIVLWSDISVESNWVRAEAGEALNKSQLIPVLLDDTSIPLVFRQIQAAPLADWDGDTAHTGFQQLVRAIRALVPLDSIEETAPTPPVQAADAAPPQTPANEPEELPAVPDPTRKSRINLRTWWLAIPVVAVVVGGPAWLLLQPDRNSDLTPVTRIPDAPPPVIAAVQVPDKTQQMEETIKETIEEAQTIVDTASPSKTKPEPTPPAEAATTKTVAKPKPVIKPTPVTAPPEIQTQVTPQAKIIVPAIKPPPKVTPLSIALVVWGMPRNEGIASPKQTETYSTDLAQEMAIIAKDIIAGSTEITFVYPGEHKHYALMRDKGDFEDSMDVCRDTSADIAIFGFVEGSEFDDMMGWLVQRKPFFAVFDCKTREHVSRRYDVYNKRGDSFPYKTGLTKTFRQFAQQEGDLARYARQ